MAKFRPDGLALETILGSEFVEVMKVQRRIPRHVSNTDLATHGVDLVLHG
jgi:hypothetical protein